MKRSLPRLGLVFAGLMLAAAGAGAGVDLELVAGGFDRPTVVTAAGDGSGRLFVAEQTGRIRVIEDGAVAARPFLDIASRVFSAGGNGLLGLAFHPDYAVNGFFFVHYVSLDRRTTISRFRVATGADRARPSSETVVFAFDEPAGNHKGGDIAFGPDGYLYLAMGDGSGGGDPDDNAQNTANLFGAVLRLDVDQVPAAAPADNPFVGDPSARDEIWAYGLRNPWRLSFDSASGDLFIADVGEQTFEEVDRQPAASAGGENYGWRRKEGSVCFEPATGCDAPELVPPILEYGRDLGCSITGGFVYRGVARTLRGHYLYGDFCSGRIWGAEPNRDGVWVSRLLAESGLSIVTFGRDDDGELYVADYATGSVFALTSREVFASGFESGRLRGWRGRGPVEVVSPGLGGSGYSLSVPAEGGSPTTARRRVPQQIAFETELSLDLSALDVSGEEVVLARWSDTVGPVLQLDSRRISPRRFELALRAGGGEAGMATVGSFRANARRPVRLRIEWRAASGPQGADGVARWSQGDRRRGELGGLATGDRRLRLFEVGLPLGAPPGSSGRLLIDDVVLSRGRP